MFIIEADMRKSYIKIANTIFICFLILTGLSALYSAGYGQSNPADHEVQPQDRKHHQLHPAAGTDETGE